MAETKETVIKRLRRVKDTNTPGTPKSEAKSPTKSKHNSETAPAPSNSMQCLTDECLQKLFEHLDVESLCQMADVCKRFRPITERAFSKCHKEFVFKGRPCKNSVFRRVLCKFGCLISSIDASEAHFAAREKLDANAIVKCCGNSLEKLILQKTTIDSDVMKPLFAQLKYLDLAECEFTGSKNALFTNCPNLEFFGFEADLYGPDPLDFDSDRSIGFVVKKFPKLKSVYFDCSYTAFRSFFDLLALNPQVTTLDIIAPAQDIYIEAVVAYTKNVEELAIHPGFMSTTPEIQTRKVFLELSKLRKLQRLYIEAGAEIYEKLAAPLMDAFAMNNVPINHLNLCEFAIGSKAIKSIIKLKTMKLMSLNEVGNVTDVDLVPMFTELPLLENVQLHFGVNAKTPITLDGLSKMVRHGKHLTYLALVGIKNLKIDQKAFDGLLKAAQSRGSEKKLKIDIVGNKKTTTFDVPEDVQRAGNKHLKVSYQVQQND